MNTNNSKNKTLNETAYSVNNNKHTDQKLYSIIKQTKTWFHSKAIEVNLQMFHLFDKMTKPCHIKVKERLHIPKIKVGEHSILINNMIFHHW